MRSSVRAMVCAAILAAGLSAEALASTKGLSDSILRAMRIDEVHAEAGKRLQVAEALLEYWISFKDRTPSITEDEQELLEAELNSGELNRQDAAVNSREYALFQLDIHYDRCINSLNQLIESIYTQADYEMYFWVRVGNCYLNVRFDDFLVIAGLSDGRADGDYYYAWNNVFLDKILNKFAVSAMVDIMEWDDGNDGDDG